MTLNPFQHAPSGALTFAPGCSALVGAQGPLKKATRVAVITDQVVRRAGLLEAALGSLGARVTLIDDGVVPDADVRHVNDLAQRARELQVDGLLAVGGGSVIDTSKGVAAVLGKGKPLEELTGFATIRMRLLPLVCIPTTAGTGSEASQFAVIKDHVRGEKRVLMDSSLVPVWSFLDPTLLFGLPRAVTAATGVDAITHAVEAMSSQMRNPIASALAAEALRLLVGEGALAASLARADDVDARGACLIAANLAGQAISSAMLGACHAFAHALGARMGVPHGVANGVFLIPVMRANLTEARPAYARVGVALGHHGDEGTLANAAIETLERVVHELAAIPRHLRDLGVGEAEVPDLVRLTLDDADLATNPVSFDEAGVRGLIVERL